MITSPATGAVLDRLRRLSGPNPEGSKLTDVERLHLIFLLGALEQGLPGCTQDHVLHLIVSPLTQRGLDGDDIGAAFIAELSSDGPANIVRVVDRLVVHPRLRHTYLD